MCVFAEKACDNESIKIYQFDTVNNNNDEATIEEKKISSRELKTSKKFRMEKHSEGASLFMQFVVLFDRNFKASSRNAVFIKEFSYLNQSICWMIKQNLFFFHSF